MIFRRILSIPQRTFLEVFSVILERKTCGDSSSYVQSLLEKGTNAILKKIGEEASEVIIAAKEERKHELIHEITDLWFHMMVLLADQELSLEEIEQEFGRRFGTSGIEEKQNRATTKTH